jgi:hypothetical protein
MITLYVFLAIYFLGFLLFSKGASFRDEQPHDRLVAGLTWPLIIGGLAWQLWTGKTTIKFSRKKKS